MPRLDMILHIIRPHGLIVALITLEQLPAMLEPVATHRSRVNGGEITVLTAQLRLAAVLQLGVALEQGRLRGDVATLRAGEAAVQMLGQLQPPPGCQRSYNKVLECVSNLPFPKLYFCSRHPPPPRNLILRPK